MHWAMERKVAGSNLGGSSLSLFSPQILKGNDNPSSPNVLTLMPYIIAKRLRIYPYTGENNRIQVCLKLELYGCAFKGKGGERVSGNTRCVPCNVNGSGFRKRSTSEQ